MDIGEFDLLEILYWTLHGTKRSHLEKITVLPMLRTHQHLKRLWEEASDLTFIAIFERCGVPASHSMGWGCAFIQSLAKWAQKSHCHQQGSCKSKPKLNYKPKKTPTIFWISYFKGIYIYIYSWKIYHKEIIKVRTNSSFRLYLSILKSQCFLWKKTSM